MPENKISLLCSGVALGVYIPAILTDYRLQDLGLSTEVLVLENLMQKDKREKIPDNKKAFHGNFRVALKGQQMAKDLRPTLDETILDRLFTRWKKEDRRNFIVFSGFWISVLKEYFKLVPAADAHVEIVHMDAVISASWKLFQDDCRHFNNIWIFNGEKKKLEYELPVGRSLPEPFSKRPERFVIHGGGWGMGTYQSKIPELTEKGMKLDIVAYDIRETENRLPGCRFFMIDPEWHPWFENKKNRHEFPPFGEIVPGKTPSFKNKAENHELYDVIRESRAVISKPGGATLLDSLASATPLIMLDPFGDYEQKNAELWESLGFGISYDKWKDSGFSMEILERMHRNLFRTRGALVDYPRDYRDRFLKQTLKY